jgi:hypothetical protein
MTLRYSRKSLAYFKTSTCAFSTEHLGAKLGTKAAGDADDGRERRNTERHAEHSERGPHRHASPAFFERMYRKASVREAMVLGENVTKSERAPNR